MNRARPSDTESSEAGFSVLEAMIAVALLAAAFLPLLEIQGRFVAATEAMERAETRIAQRQTADAFLETVNFMAQPSGETRLGTQNVVWQAQIAGDIRPVRGADGAPGRFDVALYDVVVQVSASDRLQERPTLTYRRRGLGWKARRSALDDI